MNPSAATAIHHSAPPIVARTAPIRAPKGRAPAVAIVITADTRPRMFTGVTDCLRVVVLIVQVIGPAPSRKNAVRGKPMNGGQIEAVETIEARIPTIGPMTTTRPNGSFLPVQQSEQRDSTR